jgi:hypothetical protein
MIFWLVVIVYCTGFWPRVTTKETGFLRFFSLGIEYSRKNPVSDPTRNQRTKETGFLRGFSPVTSILEKTRFLTGR